MTTLISLNVSGYELADVNKPCDISLNQEPINDESVCFNAMPYIIRKHVEMDKNVKVVTESKDADRPLGCYVNFEKNVSDPVGIYFNNHKDSEKRPSTTELKERFKENLEGETVVQDSINQTDDIGMNSSSTQDRSVKWDTRRVCRLINRTYDEYLTDKKDFNNILDLIIISQ